MSFWSFLETVRQKTILAPWLMQIKSTPKDQMVYLTLADFLGDQGGLFAQVGDYLRNAVQIQGIQDRDEQRQKEDELAGMGRQISEEFKKLGIGNNDNYSSYVSVPKKLTAHHKTDASGKLQKVKLNNADSLSKMAVTVYQTNDRPKATTSQEFNPLMKRTQDNNVALHDMADVNVQLYSIFQIAQRIAVHLLKLQGNEPDQCSAEGIEDLMHQMNDVANNWMRNQWADEDQDDLVIIAGDYRDILNCIKKTWTCCDQLTENAIDHLEQYLHGLNVDDLDQDRFGNWVAAGIVNRWLAALKTLRESGCNSYRKEISSLIKRFRNHDKVAAMFRAGQ